MRKLFEPSLGEDFVSKSVKAGLLGILATMVFMTIYYRLSGLIASIALIYYAILTLAIFKLLPGAIFTLTLAGFGGFVLSVGMAIDANVLIFERMKEEMWAGRSLGAAIDAGFNRAWPAIFDSNVTTILAGFILLWLGSSNIIASDIAKGFAVTLIIGVAVSMFTAITVTRTLLRPFVGTELAKKVSLFVPFRGRKMINIIGKRFWYFLISGVVILAGIVALAIFGLEPGIEFKSGSEITVTFEQPVAKQQVVQALTELGYDSGSAIVRRAGNDFIIDLPELTPGAKEALLAGFTSKLGKYQSGGFQSVSAQAAAETTRNAAIAVVISAIGMLLYISWAFHRMPNPFRWGVCAIASLVHDILVVIGVFAILGGFLGWQVDLMFIAAVLTVIGYSVNDTIVIFDRIRENVRNYGSADFEGVVNYSLVETMSRTLITGQGTLFVLIALLIIVGQPIQNLVVVLLVGIVTGTYSSIGTAASLLVVWKNKEWGRFIGRRPLSSIKA